MKKHSFFINNFCLFFQKKKNKMQKTNDKYFCDIEELHEYHCNNKDDFFIHPKTKLHVFTAYYLKTTQKKCCGKGCMFCPFGHENVPCIKK